jgi:tetratricopeptide (TPR) repeat protein
MDDAFLNFDEVTKLEASHMVARYHMGRILEAKGNAEESTFHYEKILEDHPAQNDYPDIFYRLGKLYARRFEGEKSIPTLRRAMQFYPDNMDIRITLLYQYQNLFLIEADKAKKTSDGEDAGDIMRFYKTRAQKEPTTHNLMDLGLAHFLRLDLDKGDEENLQASIEWLNKAIEKDRENVVAMQFLTLAFMHSNQNAKAEETANRVIGLEADNLVAHQRMSDIAIKAADYPKAVTQFKKIIQLDPDEAMWRMRLIDLYKTMYDKEEDVESRYDAVKKEFEKTIRNNPKDAMAHFDLGYAYLTLTSSFSLSEEEIQSATFEFKQLISMDKENPAGYWGLKKVYNKQSIAGQHMYDKAIDICKEALKLNTLNARAYFELGEAYNENYDRNMKNEALEQYRKAVELDPSMIEAHFKIASIYRILNNYDEAIREYNRVINLDPTSSFAKDARRSLVHIEKSRSEML